MVMAPAHAGMGFCAGLYAAHFIPPLLEHPAHPGVQVTFGLLTAGAAIVPDLDCHSATAARSLGPLSRLPARLISNLSSVVYRSTRTPRDSNRGGDHRGITHTIPGATVFAAIAAATVAYGGRNGLLGVTFVLFLFALRALPPVHRIDKDLVVSAALTLGVYVLMTEAGVTDATAPAWLGAAVLLGCLVHDLGDAPTESGCPLVFPLKIKGQRWYPVSLPKWMRFRAANKGANAAILVLSLAAAGWLLLQPRLPGLIPSAVQP